MAVEFTSETLTKEKILEMIRLWGYYYGSEMCGSAEQEAEHSLEVQAIIAWVEQHCT